MLRNFMSSVALNDGRRTIHKLLKFGTGSLVLRRNNTTSVSVTKKRMGEEVAVRVEFVEDIPRDASGKYRYVVSHVAQNPESVTGKLL